MARKARLQNYEKHSSHGIIIVGKRGRGCGFGISRKREGIVQTEVLNSFPLMF